MSESLNKYWRDVYYLTNQPPPQAYHVLWQTPQVAYAPHNRVIYPGFLTTSHMMWGRRESLDRCVRRTHGYLGMH